MHTREWEFYASLSRLKSERTKKRWRKKDLEKQLIQKHKELSRISYEKSNLGYAELVPPIQKGWKRFYVVREDVLKTNDGPFFQQLIEKINKPEFSHRKDFKVRKKHKGRKIRVERPQPLPVLELYELRKLKLTEKELMYFNMEERCDQYKRKTVWRKVLVFSEPWRFVLKVTPNLITKVRIIDPALIEVEAELESFLSKNNLYFKMRKIVDGSAGRRNHWSNDDKMKYKNLFKTEPVFKMKRDYTH